ncbi:KEOPS complex subunit Pcc1 [Thermoproteota archaeon]
MKINVDLSINFQDKKILDSVFRSLEPDNIDFPKDITFKMNSLDTTLYFNIVSKNNILSLISTLNDVIESIQITCSTLNSLKVV